MIAQVNFENIKMVSYFRYDAKKMNIKENMNVIVESKLRGQLLGKVISLCNENAECGEIFDSVIRIATKKDTLKYLSIIDESNAALDKCRLMVKEGNLCMTILDANFNFDKSQLFFRFVADERVDFRKLARDLGAVFKTRIELRQVGIRDKAKEVGGFGPCGRLLCCSTFLTSFDSVSINMAKNQSVSLNPSKINGVCGRLLCCLKYENDMYSELKKDLTLVGKILDVNGEKGKVISVNPLNNKYKIVFDNKKILEISQDDYKK